MFSHLRHSVPVRSPCARTRPLWVCACRSPPPLPEAVHGRPSYSGRRMPWHEAGSTDRDHIQAVNMEIRWMNCNASVHICTFILYCCLHCFHLGSTLVCGLHVEVQQEVSVAESRTCRSEDDLSRWIGHWVNLTSSQVIIWDLTGARAQNWALTKVCVSHSNTVHHKFSDNTKTLQCNTHSHIQTRLCLVAFIGSAAPEGCLQQTL